MKNLIFIALTTLISLPALAQEQARVGDGCYQLVQREALLTLICISGSTEEGIGGSNARIAQLDPNDGSVAQCDKTSKIETSKTAVTFWVGDNFFKFTPSSEKKGFVTDEDANRFEYIKLESQTILDRANNSIDKSKKCR
jgi:hypothetical protein